jgi:uncharacterized membrane protein YfcA
MYIELLDMSLAGLLGRIVLGLVIGFCIGLTGIGGGVLVLPALTLLLGIPPVQAVGTTSLYAFLTKITATFHHARLKTIDWGTSLRFLAGAMPANAMVSLWISRQGSDEDFQERLTMFIVGVVFFSVLMMILNMVKRSRTALETEERTLGDRITGHLLLRNSLSILMGALVGGLIGATSIGGGVLIVPIMIILFNLPASRTVGSSIFISLLLTFFTSIIYGKSGEVDEATAIIMAAGSLAGVYNGSRLSSRMPERLLQGIMIGLILLVAVLMLINQVQ